jgi:hypothetical protein
VNKIVLTHSTILPFYGLLGAAIGGFNPTYFFLCGLWPYLYVCFPVSSLRPSMLVSVIPGGICYW